MLFFFIISLHETSDLDAACCFLKEPGNYELSPGSRTIQSKAGFFC